MTGEVLGHPIDEVHRWALVVDLTDRVTVRIEDTRPSHEGENEAITFVFESPDLVRVDGGILDGHKYRRVK